MVTAAPTFPAQQVPGGVAPITPEAAGLPQANVRGQAGAFPTDEFDFIENVPVFAEHATTLRDGRRIEFGLEELKVICDRCNDRIRETGDYSAITIGHTPDPKSNNGGAPMPELVGFAGPFRIGTLGQGDRQRYAILADFHLFKSERDRIKRFPRRSPELWLEDRIEDMFLDPIALLGAEAPRLDMGLLYSALRHGSDGQRRLVEKYAAAGPGPGPGSVFIPSHGPGDGDDSKARKPYQSQETSPMAISPEDIRQIVDALEQTDWVQFVKQQMAAAGGNNASVPPVEPPAEAPAAAPPGGPPAAGPPPATPPAEPEVPAAGPPEAAGGSPPEAPPAEDQEKENLAMGGTMPAAPKGVPPKRYEANADDQYTKVPPGGSDHEHVSGTPFTGEKKNYSSADEALDDISDDEIEKFMADYCKKRFMAEGDADGDTDGGGDSSVEPDNPGPFSESGSVSDEPEEAAGTYQKATPPAKFSRRESGGEVEQYAKELQSVRGELTSTRKALEAERAARVDAERYAKLAELRGAFAFDLADELESVKYGRMSDAQFDRHVNSIRQHYKRIPLNVVVPSLYDELGISPVGPEVNREKYSRDLSQRALRICEAKAAKGEEVSYERTLEALHRGEKIEV